MRESERAISIHNSDGRCDGSSEADRAKTEAVGPEPEGGWKVSDGVDQVRATLEQRTTLGLQRLLREVGALSVVLVEEEQRLGQGHHQSRDPQTQTSQLPHLPRHARQKTHASQKRYVFDSSSLHSL